MKRTTIEQPAVSQTKSRGTRAKLMLLLVMLAIVTGVASADLATASHEVSIVIPPIKMLEVKNNWETQSVSPTQSGGTLATATATYGVTSTVENTMIRATLATQLPEGVVVKLRMQTTIGTTPGWVELREGMPANLVFGARGAEYNVVEMELIVPAGVAVNSVPISIVYMID
ncbi:MAG: hypothetical protein KAU31_03365 [Spirochaetaceae bacterium]|nr:hypothetical protein [Spirochaetaceae bacterium]